MPLGDYSAFDISALSRLLSSLVLHGKWVLRPIQSWSTPKEEGGSTEGPESHNRFAEIAGLRMASVYLSGRTYVQQGRPWTGRWSISEANSWS